MPCYHPLLGKLKGYSDSGKPLYNITSMEESALNNFDMHDVVQIPCGKCLGCRLQYAQDWSNRLLMELKCHDSAYFCTLTYDDEHVPKVIYDGDDDFVLLETLVKSDVQKFIKRLRKNFPEDHIRYYITGEYGDQTFRPHYHGIIFGLHLYDVEEKGVVSVNNEPVLYSKIFEDIWSLGFAELGSVTANSTGYVARYVTKKVHNDQREEEIARGQEPEFALMSRKPAIGRLFFDQHPDMFDYISYHMDTEKGSVNIFPSRYFKKLIDDQTSKVNRYYIGKTKRNTKLSLTNLNYLDMLNAEEINKKNAVSILKRDKI